MLLTDATAPYDEVNVTISSFSVHVANESESDSTSGWVVISDEPQTFDLLTLSNGITALLGEKTLQSGHYTQVRLSITEAEVVIDSVAHDLTIPSSELKFVSGFDVPAGGEIDLVIDFDAARSIHQANSGTYILRPTIRVIDQSETGSIGGLVTNYSNLPVAYAIADTDTVTSTPVNAENGQFTLAFLPVGTYTVVVSNSPGLSSTTSSVAVTDGNKTDLGNLTLQ